MGDSGVVLERAIVKSRVRPDDQAASGATSRALGLIRDVGEMPPQALARHCNATALMYVRKRFESSDLTRLMVSSMLWYDALDLFRCATS